MKISLQGLKTADSPTSLLKAVYEAEAPTNSDLAPGPAKIAYEPGTNQSLVILGDFSTDTPPGALRHPPAGSHPLGRGKAIPPNVLFQIFSHAATEEPVRLRIINGMPGKRLAFIAGRQEILVEPGEFAIPRWPTGDCPVSGKRGWRRHTFAHAPGGPDPKCHDYFLRKERKTSLYARL